MSIYDTSFYLKEPKGGKSPQQGQRCRASSGEPEETADQQEQGSRAYPGNEGAPGDGPGEKGSLNDNFNLPPQLKK